MTELKATGLVDLSGEDNAEKEIVLKDEFHWFLENRFAELRGLKEKTRPYTSHDKNDIMKNKTVDYREKPFNDMLGGKFLSARIIL
jgi:hypothetical protein